MTDPPILTYYYPKSDGLPWKLHHLRNSRICLERTKEWLGKINKALLDPELTVVILKGAGRWELWEEEEWEEWEAKSAEEKRPLMDKLCNDEVERVSVISTTVLEAANLLYPWQQRKFIGNLSSSLILYLEVLNHLFTEGNLRTIHELEKHFNALEPKHKWKKLGGRMFIPSGYPSKP
jgi:hypothetical protein